VIAPGINAKMNEFQAALGLLQLKYIEKTIEKRKALTERYRCELHGIPGIAFMGDMPGVKHSYTHFPIFIDEKMYGKSRDMVYEELKNFNIFPRRYFYPLISHFPPYNELESAAPEKMPVAESAAEKVLCLPLYDGLESDEQDAVIHIIKQYAMRLK